IERRAGVGRSEFFERYYAENRPVILTDVGAAWPARRWTPEHLEAVLRDTPVEVMAGRDAVARYDVDPMTHQRTVPVSEFAARVREGGDRTQRLTPLRKNAPPQQAGRGAAVARSRADARVHGEGRPAQQRIPVVRARWHRHAAAPRPAECALRPGDRPEALPHHLAAARAPRLQRRGGVEPGRSASSRSRALPAVCRGRTREVRPRGRRGALHPRR